jgi:RNA polymerase sigma-B factor
MRRAASSLLRDWELLTDSAVPALLEVTSRREPLAWTIGTAEDAVALAAAYSEVSEGVSDKSIRIFLSRRPPTNTAVQFAATDIRYVPSNRRGSFVRRDRRWFPEDRLFEGIVLREPSRWVDLVTIRRLAPSPGSDASQARVGLDHLRRGGHALFVEDVPSGLSTRDLKPVGESGRLFQKVSGGKAPPPSVSAPADAETLAGKQEQTRLVESHYALARALARRFSRYGESTDDLEQVALVALVAAARRYSPEHGASFSTFATASVLGELKRHFRDKTWMLRVPRSLKETYLDVKTAREELGHRLRTSPTVEQIAEHLCIPAEDVLAAMEAGYSYWPASLDTPGADDEEPVTDVPVTERGYEAALNRRQLKMSLPQLSRKEQLVVRRLYFDGWTQRRVADELGVSQMQVSRLMSQALVKLRPYFEERSG